MQTFHLSFHSGHRTGIFSLHGSSDTANLFKPQELCSSCYFHLEYISFNILISFRSSIRCHLHRKAFPDCSSKINIPSLPSIKFLLCFILLHGTLHYFILSYIFQAHIQILNAGEMLELEM